MSSEKQFKCSGKITLTFSPVDTFQELFDRMIADFDDEGNDSEYGSTVDRNEPNIHVNLSINFERQNRSLMTQEKVHTSSLIKNENLGGMCDEDTFAEIGSHKFNSSMRFSNCTNLSELNKSADNCSFAVKGDTSSPSMDVPVIEMDQMTPMISSISVGSKLKKKNCPSKKPLSPHARKCQQSSHWLNRL